LFCSGQFVIILRKKPTVTSFLFAFIYFFSHSRIGFGSFYFCSSRSTQYTRIHTFIFNRCIHIHMYTPQLLFCLISYRKSPYRNNPFYDKFTKTLMMMIIIIIITYCRTVSADQWFSYGYVNNNINDNNIKFICMCVCVCADRFLQLCVPTLFAVVVTTSSFLCPYKTHKSVVLYCELYAVVLVSVVCDVFGRRTKNTTPRPFHRRRRRRSLPYYILHIIIIIIIIIWCIVRYIRRRLVAPWSRTGRINGGPHHLSLLFDGSDI